jgi:polysaccharide export outer membrane protein
VIAGTTGSKRGAWAAWAIAACALTACNHVGGKFVWVDDYRESGAEGAYVIGPGDVLQVRVFKQENLSGRVRVRSDGMISLPFVDDLRASGATPRQLSGRIEEQLKSMIVNPVVGVSVEEQRTAQVSVLGEVARPGVYPIDRGSGLLQALAASGGKTEFASEDRIFVIRAAADPPAPPTRIRFTFRSLTGAEGAAVRFRLRDGDVVVVE